MGFWQGLNEGFAAVEEQRTRKRERQEEVDIRKQEIADSRAYDKEMFFLKLKEDRLTVLQERELARRAADREAQAVSEATVSFLGRLGGVDPKVVDAYRANPQYAAKVELALRDAERTRAEKGQKGPVLMGNLLVEQFPPPTSSVPSPTIDLENFENLDVMDNKTYFDLLEKTAIPAKKDLLINPNIYYVPDPKVLEEGRKQVETKVLELALAYQRELNTDKTRAEHAQFSEKLKKFTEVGSPERVEIMNTFGPAAVVPLLGGNNPYIQDLINTPEFSGILENTVAELRRGINDPTTTEEEKETARRILKNKFGVTE